MKSLFSVQTDNVVETLTNEIIKTPWALGLLAIAAGVSIGLPVGVGLMSRLRPREPGFEAHTESEEVIRLLIEKTEENIELRSHIREIDLAEREATLKQMILANQMAAQELRDVLARTQTGEDDPFISGINIEPQPTEDDPTKTTHKENPYEQ